MAIGSLRKLSAGFVPIAAMFIVLLVSLYLMGAATQNSEQFGDLYFELLIINILGLIALVILIGANLVRLVRQYRNRATGSRLTVRLVIMFVVLALTPVSVVYYFSLDFIQRGIDSWFDVRVEKALDDALELSRASLDARMRELLRKTEQIRRQLGNTDPVQYSMVVNDLRTENDVYELMLMTGDGQIVTASSVNPADIVPNMPNSEIFRQVRQSGTYVGLETIADNELYARVLVELTSSDPEMIGSRYLQALYPISGRMSVLAESVQSAYAKYKNLTVLRDPLKYSFSLTLSLVLLLTLLTAVWTAFFSARRLVAPIRALAIGTRAVASGDYGKRLPMHSSDELGFLVQSFNDMTRKISLARDQASQSQRQAESERAYLRAVLGRLSSGVLTLDKRRIIRTANASAANILGIDLKGCIGHPLEKISEEHPFLAGFVGAIKPNLAARKQEWREELVIFGVSGRQVLTCGGSSLPGEGDSQAGYVIVFDDVTILIQVQRDAAWGEVARRLAHEIKNPLTPIQLSAERLRHKYLKTMDPRDAEVLDRSTHTIVQQVETMKEMVKAFSEYARSPQLKLIDLDMNGILNEVLDLYRGNDPGVTFELHLGEELPPVAADAGRLRQLLHNLMKNSIEAGSERTGCRIMLTTTLIKEGGARMVELQIEDNGPGVPEEMMPRLFEPYVTTKPKGSGLGLAIVKKIVEEHSGMVWAENSATGGLRIIIRLPTGASQHAAADRKKKQGMEGQPDTLNAEPVNESD